MKQLEHHWEYAPQIGSLKSNYSCQLNFNIVFQRSPMCQDVFFLTILISKIAHVFNILPIHAVCPANLMHIM